MPREALLNNEIVYNAIINSANITIFKEDGSVKAPSDEVWQRLSNELDNVDRPKNLYTKVVADRGGILTKLRLHFKVAKKDPKKNYEDIFELPPEEKKLPPQVNFHTILSSKIWEKIKPIEKTRRRNDTSRGKRIDLALPSGWGDHLIKELWSQWKIPCPYTFHKSQVSKDAALRQQFVKIEANCKECFALGVGIIKNEPREGDEVILYWSANDTRGIKHSLKRFLKGEQRERFAENSRNQSADVFRRGLANEVMNFGDPQAPFLYSTEVIRKVQQEDRKKQFYQQIGSQGSEFHNLVHMKNNAEQYVGCIHLISLDETMVHYSTPSQLEVYKNYTKNNYSEISIDATGSLIKKIARENHLSGHLFLYEVVINDGRDQLPVYQMLSERHDTNAISYWLQEWRRMGAPIPNETTMDNSKALLGAAARAIAGCVDLKDYKSRCFEVALGLSADLPSSFIRIDVAHIMKAFCRWPETQAFTIVKDFVIRSFVVLLEADNLNKFRTVLKNILTLCFAKYYGYINSMGKN